MGGAPTPKRDAIVGFDPQPYGPVVFGGRILPGVVSAQGKPNHLGFASNKAGPHVLSSSSRITQYTNKHSTCGRVPGK